MLNLDKINTSNLLNHNEKEEPPCKNGYSFRFQGIIDKNIEQLKILNSYLCPILDKDTFYTQVLKRGPHFNYYGVYNDIAVSALCTKMEYKDKLIITTLYVLPRYRNLGIGSRLLDKVNEIGKKNGAKTLLIYLPAGDEATLSYLLKRGFEKQQELVNNDFGEAVLLSNKL